MVKLGIDSESTKSLTGFYKNCYTGIEVLNSLTSTPLISTSNFFIDHLDVVFSRHKWRGGDDAKNEHLNHFRLADDVVFIEKAKRKQKSPAGTCNYKQKSGLKDQQLQKKITGNHQFCFLLK